MLLPTWTLIETGPESKLSKPSRVLQPRCVNHCLLAIFPCICLRGWSQPWPHFKPCLLAHHVTQLPDGNEPGLGVPGWQRHAALALHATFRVVLPAANPSARAMFRSQSGPHAGAMARRHTL